MQGRIKVVLAGILAMMSLFVGVTLAEAKPTLDTAEREIRAVKPTEPLYDRVHSYIYRGGAASLELR